MSFARLIKGVWGILITIVTIVLAYGGYAFEQATFRPSLVLSYSPSDNKFHKQHGPYSHRYRIENTGNIVAKQAKISAITRQSGSTPHADENKPLGDILPKESIGWAIYVHGIVEEARGRPRYEITEDIELTYRGKSILRFWCDPVYFYKVTFVYNERDARWGYHLEKVSTESVRCE